MIPPQTIPNSTSSLLPPVPLSRQSLLSFDSRVSLLSSTFSCLFFASPSNFLFRSSQRPFSILPNPFLLFFCQPHTRIPFSSEKLYVVLFFQRFALVTAKEHVRALEFATKYNVNRPQNHSCCFFLELVSPPLSTTSWIQNKHYTRLLQLLHKNDAAVVW